jgi:DNA-binding NtrC family response regulator
MILGGGEEIIVDDLPNDLAFPKDRQSGSPFPALPATGLSMEEMERQLLMQALEKAGGNQTKAARFLQISRDTFRYRIKKHGLAPLGES